MAANGLFALASAAAIPDCDSAQSLHLTSNGTFQLSVFEDLHYGEAENLVWGPQQDVNSTRVMNTVLNEEKQQLVVLNGDLITGENTYLSNSTAYVDEIVAPLVQRGLRWASTYGNHDSDFNISRQGMYAREKRYSNSLTGNMVSNSNAGVSNYYLPIYAQNSTSRKAQKPAFFVWFFDSRGGNYFQSTNKTTGDAVPQPNWVDASVVDWFTATNTALEKQYQASIPSIAFVHIPVNAMLDFQNQGVDPNREPGINDDVPLAQQGATAGQGTSAIGFTYSGQDVPFMQALLRTKGLMAVFSGHDHGTWTSFSLWLSPFPKSMLHMTSQLLILTGDSWCMPWLTNGTSLAAIAPKGPALCFGQHSGYGGYGSWIRGSRQIVLDAARPDQIETWIRLEDGSESGRVVLNGTYGGDEYPAVVDIYT